MDTIQKASQSAHEAVDVITNVTTQAVDALGEKGEQFKNAEQQMLEDCRNYVHNNPISSLGIAAAAGFILSRLISSR
ncbi:MAG: DUF883 domain-containing protein [Methylococcales bacterium]|nr:DUF883 family protein [Methylococcaceae bacterium]